MNSWDVSIVRKIGDRLRRPASIAPLVVLRILFGGLMLAGTVRFALKGWIRELYVLPEFFFSYYGFEWVTAPGEWGLYGLFLLMGLSALGIMLGYRYRLSAALFFLCFSWVELIDKTNYLNHYYFVSLVSFLLVLVPAHRSFSLDVLRDPGLKTDRVPAWTVGIFKLQLGIVYFYAGLAKLNPDWLLDAMPLKIWLPARSHLPLIGGWLEQPLTAYLFSWAGAVYDLTVTFFLLYRPTRAAAYAAVVLFHGMTALLFPIGMFPYIMIGCTLIFFSPRFHESLLKFLRKAGARIAGLQPPGAGRGRREGDRRISAASGHEKGRGWGPKHGGLVAGVLAVFFALQLLLPHRHLLYPGNVFWTEEGYRFSWRVMLMEKAGHAVFHIRDPESGRRWEASNYEFLTPAQEKMMATQPDMILQFAHHLEEVYRERGMDDVEITAEVRVTLNGRRSRLMVDPEVDLTKRTRGFHHKDWILPYDAEQETWFDNDGS